MQAHAIPVVQKSWPAVTVIAAAAAELFYCNLHTLDPSLQRLFKADMSVQDEKLMRMIGIAVAKLDDMAILITALQKLRRAPQQLGVRDAHDATFGEALLGALQTGLGEAFTPAVAQAWSSVNGLIASVLISAGTACDAAAEAEAVIL